MIDVLRVAVPFLIALLQVLCISLALGLIPALWMIGRQHHYRMLCRWGVFALVCIGLAAYGMPKAHASWKFWVTVQGAAPRFFKDAAMWLGYFVSVLFAPMVFPEPLRLARKRMRHDRHGENARRGHRAPR